MKNEAYDQDLFLREMEETLGFIEAKSGMINKTAIQLRKLIAKAKTDLKSGVLSESDYSDFMEEYERLYANMIRTTTNLSYKLQPYIFEKKRSTLGAIVELDNIKFWEEEMGIAADYINDHLIVSMPLLPKDLTVMLLKNKSNRYNYPVTYLHYYDRIIVTQINRLDENVLEKTFRWETKSVNIFHVFDEKITTIPDTDNHDCKKAIDAVCTQFCTGDSALTTSVAMHTVRSNTIPSGSYFIVKEGRNVLDIQRGIELISVFFNEDNFKKRKDKMSKFIQTRKGKLSKTDLDNEEFLKNTATENRIIYSVKSKKKG